MSQVYAWTAPTSKSRNTRAPDHAHGLAQTRETRSLNHTTRPMYITYVWYTMYTYAYKLQHASVGLSRTRRWSKIFHKIDACLDLRHEYTAMLAAPIGNVSGTRAPATIVSNARRLAGAFWDTLRSHSPRRYHFTSVCLYACVSRQRTMTTCAGLLLYSYVRSTQPMAQSIARL